MAILNSKLLAYQRVNLDWTRANRCFSRRTCWMRHDPSNKKWRFTDTKHRWFKQQNMVEVLLGLTNKNGGLTNKNCFWWENLERSSRKQDCPRLCIGNEFLVKVDNECVFAPANRTEHIPQIPRVLNIWRPSSAVKKNYETMGWTFPIALQNIIEPPKKNPRLDQKMGGSSSKLGKLTDGYWTFAVFPQ